MPFTLAHPGAVILVKSRYFNLSGLVLGAMAPDFMYFILFSPSSNFGHTLLGAIVLNLPLCFLLNELYYKFLKNAFIANLPSKQSKAYSKWMVQPNPVRSLKGAFVFFYSSLLGMFTHVFWDAFTHNTGYFVTRWSLLMQSISVMGHSIHVYKICQHGSTLIGFAIMGVFLHRLDREGGERKILGAKESGLKMNQPLRTTKAKLAYHASAWLMGLMVMVGSYLFFKGNFPIGRGVVSLVNGLLLGYLFLSVSYYYKNQQT